MLKADSTWIETPLVTADSVLVFFQNWRAARRSLNTLAFGETLGTLRRHLDAT